MADSDKKARIAAARKKLKQLQKNNQTIVSTIDNAQISRFTNNKDMNDSHEGAQNSDSSHHIGEGKAESLLGSKSNAPNKSWKGLIEEEKKVFLSINSLHSNNELMTDSNNKVMTASTEKLYSLTRQVTGLVSESTAYLNGDISGNSNNLDDLEIRNQELASRLEKQTQANNILLVQVEEMKQHNDKLQSSLESERNKFEEKLKRDLTALKEQLQVHIQTVGILVAEKTELQSTCNQALKLSETRQSEIEELAGRLKASRQRVTDLEKNLSTLNSSNQKLEKVSKELTKDLDKLKMETYKNNKSREELQQHNLELQGRLQQKIHEVTKLEDSSIELKGKLEMSELYVEQLKNGQDRPDSNVTKQIEKILTEKTELQTKLQQQDESMKILNRERENMLTQYNHYIEQLHQQNKDLQYQLEKLMKEKETEVLKMDELESNLNQLKTKQAKVTDDQIHEHEEKTHLMETVENLVSQLMAASKNLEVQMADNSQLSRLIIEKEQMILEMEQQIERIDNSTVDRDKMLETMQSDKTALSRAIAQNKELKTQFLELQEKFVKMSQKNMDVMTKLQGEEHNGRELLQRFYTQEEELKQLKQLLEEKSIRLNEVQLRRQNNNLDKNETSSEDEIEDKNKTLAQLFRFKVPLIENLQKELSSAQDTINALTNQNSELRSRIILLERSPSVTVELDPNDPTGRSAAKYDVMKTSITQLEMEKQQIVDQLKESLKIQSMFKEKMETMQRDLATQTPATLNGDIVTNVHFEALQHAMQQLEEKYTKVMRDKAELIDRVERLEHIILQLQGETDTIGEYVSLYHHQRYLMKQRTEEKDGHINKLSVERTELQKKFKQLQTLVVQLLRERNFQINDAMLDTGIASVTNQDHEAGHGALTLPESDRKKGRSERIKNAEEGGEDWPNYSDSSDEDSQSKAFVHVTSTVANGPVDQSEPSPPSTPPHRAIPNMPPSSSSPNQKQINIPSEDAMVQQIMNLLNEIDCSTNDELFETPFFCPNCVGTVVIV